MINDPIVKHARRGVNIRSSQKERLGYVLFDAQQTPVPCRVRESNDEGAMLTIDGWMGVPDSFVLFLESRRNRHKCRVISKRGNCIRVEFAT